MNFKRSPIDFDLDSGSCRQTPLEGVSLDDYLDCEKTRVFKRRLITAAFIIVAIIAWIALYHFDMLTTWRCVLLGAFTAYMTWSLFTSEDTYLQRAKAVHAEVNAELERLQTKHAIDRPAAVNMIKNKALSTRVQLIHTEDPSWYHVNNTIIAI